MADIKDHWRPLKMTKGAPLYKCIRRYKVINMRVKL